MATGLKAGRPANTSNQNRAVTKAIAKAYKAPAYTPPVKPPSAPIGGGGGWMPPARTVTPPSPWTEERRQALLGNSQDSAFGPNSAIGRYLQQLNQQPRPAEVVPRSPYYEDQTVLVQNNLNGNYALMPLGQWDTGNFERQYTPVSKPMYMDETPYLDNQLGMMEFSLTDPSWVGQVVPATSPLEMMPVTNTGQDYHRIFPQEPWQQPQVASNPFIAYLAQLYPELYGRF